MILLIDNYDSFTYNLYQYMGIFEKDIKVVRNDKITIEEIEQLNPNRIVLSPGPKSPKEAGICMDVVKHFYTKKPILGICLGHQSIGAAFGAKIIHAKELMHGKQSLIEHDGKSVFEAQGGMLGGVHMDMHPAAFVDNGARPAKTAHHFLKLSHFLIGKLRRIHFHTVGFGSSVAVCIVTVDTSVVHNRPIPAFNIFNRIFIISATLMDNLSSQNT